MAPHTEPKDWQILAEQASKEMDGNKLSDTIERLCAALDRASVSGGSPHAALKTDITRPD
jgi:hypothetical protein